jgi:acyl-CoA synthetase (NDP forming)
VLSSGFGEGMGAGADILAEVAADLAGTPMRLLGPNCEGLASLRADAPLTFSPVLDADASGIRLRPGNIAVVSQSGGLGFAVAQRGTEAGLDFSYIISTGNELDLDCLEVAGHLVADPDTDVVILLIEAFRAMPEFARVAGRFRAAGKRLVVARLATSAAGARGALAHTSHVAGDGRQYARALRAQDVAEVRDEEELIDVVQAIAKSRRLGTRPLPRAGARIAIATTSGGAGVWLADACSARGLEVPELSGQLQERLTPFLPPFGSPVNPVDLTAQFIAHGALAPTLEVLLASGEADAVALAMSLSSADRLEPDADALRALIDRYDTPLVVYSYTRPAPPCARILQDLGLPWYTTATRTARGLSALTQGPHPEKGPA